MRRLLTLLLLLLACATQASTAFRSQGLWMLDPKAFKPTDIYGLYAWYDFTDPLYRTLNGAGISKVADKSWVPGRLENLLVQSETFSTSWSLTRCNAFGAIDTGAVGAGSFENTSRTTDPLGGNTADFIQEDATATQTHPVIQSVTFPSGTVTISVYAKAASRDCGIYCVGNAKGKMFDLAGGTVGGNIAGAPDSASIESVGGSWYRCSITLTTTGGANQVAIYPVKTGATSYSGNSTDGLFLWGAQLRRATSSSTYVATTTVAEDASRDLLQSTAANQPLVSRADNKGNLLVRSEEFSTTWNRTRCNAFGATDTGALGAGSFANTSRTTDPLGNNTADFIQEDGTAVNTHCISQEASGANAKNNNTFSAYIKAAGRTEARLTIYEPGFSGSVYGTFDLSAVTATPANVGTGSGAAATISNTGGGWYLCTVSGVSHNVDTTTVKAFIFCSVSGNNSYNGDNTSGLYLWGASLRQSTWDSDYIPTTATIAVPGLNGKTTAYFDGAAHYLKTAGMASLVQPETVIASIAVLVDTGSKRAWDGLNAGSGALRLGGDGTVGLYAGSTDPSVSFPTNTFVLLRGTYNGAASSISTNNGAAIIGNPGAANMGGFTVGANGTGTANSSIRVQHVLLFNRVLDAWELDKIKTWARKEGGAALNF